MNRTSEVFLAVDSDTLSAAELQMLVGAPPDDGWNVGDAYQVAGKEKICKFSRWSVAERAPETSQIDDAAERLVDRLAPIESNLLALPAGLRIAFSICVDQESTVFGVGLSAKTMAFVGRIGAELDMSIVVHRGAS